ncbi:putative c6 zinc finger domain containing protein [Phaeomoniella chlamydospora]|uniref:Putative c6 zinc finger domain containing protein n=1 Tax=Phaeomoniella chlamydospora TaxID=158046 RepID=A0A0G2EL99_PHACM|nr:putative c6 zinc finger domain containing protein [Phaeomoniella chlamydospora]
MIMSFVSPEPVNEPYRQTTSFSGSGSTTLEDDGATEKKIVPHPWSGVAPRIQMLFAEVGRLLRYVYTPSLATTVPAQVETLLKSAKELEEELLSADIPGPDDIVDTGDARTSKQDFIIIADVTRCSALLEIYRVFPNLLQSRLGGGIPFAFGSSIEALDDFDYEAEPSRWLTSFAIYILENLGKIPSSSGTRPLQLILLNVCANELRLSSVHASSADLGDVMAQNIQTYKSRSFVMSRLLELSTRLPAKPVLKIIDLIKEVWRRSDLGENLFWMEIMNQNGWQTVMG